MLRLFRNNNRRREELLSIYIDGRASAREKAEVERLLASSEEWRTELESLRATVEMVRSSPRAQPRRSFALTPAMVVTPAPQRTWTPRRAAAPLATAAAALALTFSLVGGATDLFGSTPQAVPQGAPEAPGPASEPAAGEPGTRGLAPESAQADAGAPPAEGLEAAAAEQAPDASTEMTAIPELVDGGSRFPWLALELAFGIVTGLLGAATIWLYRRSRRKPNAPSDMRAGR